MNWDGNSTHKVYEIFRAKMHEVYRENRKVDPFGDSMTEEFNAWQNYLRNSLKLDVVDVDKNPSDLWGMLVGKDGSTIIKIPNPSNGAHYGHESIMVPEDFAEKVVVLGSLPEGH